MRAATLNPARYLSLPGVGELVPGASTTAGSFVASNELQVNLPAGISVLRLRAAAGKNIWLRDLAVQQK